MNVNFAPPRAPDTLKGLLWKQSPTLGDHKLREVVLENGEMRWYKSAKTSTRMSIRSSLKLGATLEPEIAGSLDFHSNPCLVEKTEGSAVKFTVRPSHGDYWNNARGSFSAGADKARVFCFDATDSEHDRNTWLASIRAHISYARERKDFSTASGVVAKTEATCRRLRDELEQVKSECRENIEEAELEQKASHQDELEHVKGECRENIEEAELEQRALHQELQSQEVTALLHRESMEQAEFEQRALHQELQTRQVGQVDIQLSDASSAMLEAEMVRMRSELDDIEARLRDETSAKDHVAEELAGALHLASQARRRSRSSSGHRHEDAREELLNAQRRAKCTASPRVGEVNHATVELQIELESERRQCWLAREAESAARATLRDHVHLLEEAAVAVQRMQVDLNSAQEELATYQATLTAERGTEEKLAQELAVALECNSKISSEHTEMVPEILEVRHHLERGVSLIQLILAQNGHGPRQAVESSSSDRKSVPQVAQFFAMSPTASITSERRHSLDLDLQPEILCGSRSPGRGKAEADLGMVYASADGSPSSSRGLDQAQNR